jgi:hypothetical protein
MGSLGMLFYVVECFTVNLENLAADAVGGAQLGGIDEQIKGDGGFVAVAFCKTAHQVNQIGALYAERTEVRDDLAEFGALIFDRLLEAGEATNSVFWGGRCPAAQDVELDFDAQEGLQDSIMKIAGDAAALGFDGAGA